MVNFIQIGNRRVGDGYPVYIIAEMSANHDQEFDEAVRIIHAAKDAGADAIKLQTYTPDTITMDSQNSCFKIGGGTLWDGRTLYDLYKEAYTPWDWQPKLKTIADDISVDLFSSAFDPTSVDFLEKMKVSAHKISSFEINDIPLIEKMAGTGKPLIISTGMATLSEIEEAVHTARNSGATQIALLKCTSSYPALPEEMNLKTIPNMIDTFQAPVGLSDHTLGIAVSVAAVSLGACIIEKHFTLSRKKPGTDSNFSLEPQEFEEMVQAVRTVEKALGRVRYGACENEVKSRAFRRSLFVIENLKAGEIFTEKNVRSIRPAHGLHPRHLRNVLGKKARHDLKRGIPLKWEDVSL